MAFDIELNQISAFFFQLLVAGLTSVSLLEKESVFGIVTQLANTGERPSPHL
jgi:hypothetical protein